MNNKEYFEQNMELAQKGDANAQYAVGMAYHMGNGVGQNLENAVEWWTKSSKKGNGDAQFALGLCYLEGVGVEKDSVKAAKLFVASFDSNGHELALREYYELCTTISFFGGETKENIQRIKALQTNRKAPLPGFPSTLTRHYSFAKGLED